MCLETSLPDNAVKICLEPRNPDGLRLAAGGLLVNLCADAASKGRVPVDGALEAAEALRQGTGNVQRCGQALCRLLATAKSSAIAVRATDDPTQQNQGDGTTELGGGSFTGIFAVRGTRNTERPALKDAGCKTSAENPKSEGAKRSKAATAHTIIHQRRGPGWQRAPRLDNPSKSAVNDSPRSTNSGDAYFGEWAIGTHAVAPDPSDGKLLPEAAGVAKVEDLVMIPSQAQEAESPEESISPRSWDWESEAGEQQLRASATIQQPRPKASGIKGNEAMKNRLAELREAKVGQQKNSWLRFRPSSRAQQSAAQAVSKDHQANLARLSVAKTHGAPAEMPEELYAGVGRY